MNYKMKDSGIEWIGEIPFDWKLTRLKDYYIFEKGKNAAKYTQEYIGQNKGDYPVYSGQTENDGIMGKINSYDYDIGECLFTTTVGAKVMTPKILKGKFNLSQNCLIMNRTKDCDNRFVFYLLYPLFNYEKSLIPSYMQPSLRMSDLNKYQFYLPSIVEQQKIADFLEKEVFAINDIIEKTTSSIEEYMDYRQAVISNSVTKGLNSNVNLKDSGIQWIGNIPSDYNVVKFSKVARVASNLVHPNGYLEYKQVSPENIEKNSGKLLECNTVSEVGVVSDNHLFFKGQILYSKVRPKLNKVTIATFDGLCSADMYPIETSLNTKYLMYYMLSNSFLTQVTLNDNRVKMPKINREELSAVLIVVPTPIEQQLIAEFLVQKCAEIDNVIEQKKQLINELENYKKSLIYECVTGKREVG